MTQPSDDEFTDKMWQHMQLVNGECTKKINGLRSENTALKLQLEKAKLRYYELQEQNVAMQMELEARMQKQAEPNDRGA